MRKTIKVEHNNEMYTANFYPNGKTCLGLFIGVGKPCLEIRKNDKVIYEKKSYNNFVSNSYFTKDGIISLINSRYYIEQLHRVKEK
jgi:hypothetical protein